MLRAASFFALLLSLTTNAFALEKPSFHFVITGGLMGVADGSRLFFNSPLFRLKSTTKDGERFVITDAQSRAFRFQNTVFIPANPPTPFPKGGQNSTVVAFGTVKGFMGAQLFAVGSREGTLVPTDLGAEDLTRELGAVPSSLRFEIRKIDDIDVLALTSQDKKIVWPKEGDFLEPILVVRGRFGANKNSEHLFFPREVASTDRVFGTVDTLLKTDPQARYIDLGDALFGQAVENVEMAQRLQAIMLKRNPAVLGAAWHDFRAFWQDASLIKNGPYVAALNTDLLLPSTRLVMARNKAILFAALPTSAPLLDMILPEGASVLGLDQALERIGAETRKEPSAFVLGLTQDAASASKAIESPIFDAVLSLVPSKGGALPSYDEIDLSQNRRDGLRSVAPLVRVSSADVTELSGYVDEAGGLTKLVIRRHAVLDDGVKADDASQLVKAFEKTSNENDAKMPSRVKIAIGGPVYDESDFNAVLGGLLKNAQSDTEVAIIEKLDAMTPIESEIPLRLAESLLNDRGRAIWLEIRGKYLKRIFKAIKENHFGVNVAVVGATLKGPLVGLREVADTEDYKIVVSERVFYAIDRFMSRESLFAMRTLPSSSVQTALLEGGKDTLKILAEIRRRENRDEPNIGESRSLFAASYPIADIIEPALARGLSADEVTSFIKYRDGRISPTFIIDISDLDLGFKFNAVNDTLSAWQEDAKTPNENPGFLEPRFWDPSFSQKLFYAKASLKYIGTWLDAEVGTNIKFFQPNSEPPVAEIKDILKYRPAKDSVKFEGELRLPFRRLFDQPPLGFWDLGPIARTTYETQIWPNKWLTNWPEDKWPHRVNDIRLLLGMSAKPVASEEVVRLGGVIDYDFSRDSSAQSFGYGIEAGGQGKWSVGFINLKLETSVRQLFPVTTPDKTRMGLIWLIDGKIEVPIYEGFSVSMLTNTTFGTRMNDPLDYGYSVLFGFALSYSDRLKWLL